MLQTFFVFLPSLNSAPLILCEESGRMGRHPSIPRFRGRYGTPRRHSGAHKGGPRATSWRVLVRGDMPSCDGADAFFSLSPAIYSFGHGSYRGGVPP